MVIIIILRYELVYALEFCTMSFGLIFELNTSLCVPSDIFGDRNYVFLALSRDTFKGLLLFIAKSTYSVKPKLPLLFSTLSHSTQFKETNVTSIIFG